MAMAPGKNYLWGNTKRNLTHDLNKIKHTFEVDFIVCLIEEEEMQWLGIANELKECANLGIPTEHYPIEDMDTPGDIPRFKALVRKVVDEFLRNGKKVMVHCQGGNGRTGIFIAACLIYKGYTPSQAIQKTRQVRRFAIQSRRQESFVRQLSF